jgi:hypothetical protein
MGGAAFVIRPLPVNAQVLEPISRSVARILEAAEGNSFLEAKAGLDALIGGAFRLPDPRLEKLADAVRQMAGPAQPIATSSPRFAGPSMTAGRGTTIGHSATTRPIPWV